MTQGFHRRGSLWAPADARPRYIGRGSTARLGGGGTILGALVSAGSLFVSPTGSDANNGTESHPFATINKAASVVNPGDVVIVENGIWQDTHAALGSPSIVEVGRGGTAAQMVTFRARNYLGAKLDGQNGVANQGFNFRNNVGWVRIEGFDIYGAASLTGSCAGIDTFAGGHDSIISLCDIHDCGRICIAHGFGQNGIFVGAVNVTVERSRIHHIGRLGPTEGCGTPGPYQTNDHGIYHADGNGLTVRSCLLYRNEHGWSIQEYPSARSGLRVLYNTFAYGNPYQLFTHLVLDAALSDSQLIGNIFFDPAPGRTIKAFGSNSAFVNVTLQKNLTMAVQMTDPGAPVTGITEIGNLVSTDPLLVDSPNYDFRLLAGSPAIDAGIAVPDAVYDFAGVGRPRGAGFDIGAYER